MSLLHSPWLSCNTFFLVRVESHRTVLLKTSGSNCRYCINWANPCIPNSQNRFKLGAHESETGLQRHFPFPLHSVWLITLQTRLFSRPLSEIFIPRKAKLPQFILVSIPMDTKINFSQKYERPRSCPNSGLRAVY